VTDAPEGRADVQAALRCAGLPPLPRTAWLAIDLDRLRENLAALRALVAPGTLVDPVVKADAYGHGAVPVARALEDSGADGFGVATLDEALELRAGGVRAPILVLYPVPPALARQASVAGVALTLGDETLTERTLVSLADGPLERPLEVHLEVETGLGRGGFDPAALPRVLARIRLASGIRLAGIWSHLGSADDPERSARQGQVFDAAAAPVAGSHHLAASGGLIAGSAAPWQRVRPGLSIYGLAPEGLEIPADRASLAGRLAPVLSLRAQPVRVATLPAGAGVSYGDAFVTRRESRIATLPVGYGDGYQRIRTGRAEALVRGRRVPLVGTIAMDAVMADVTDIPGPSVTVDDEFVLLGRQGAEEISAVDLARLGTTISWEVLAGMARRLPRVYYAGAVPVGLRTLTDERGWWTEPERRTAPGSGVDPSAGRTDPADPRDTDSNGPTTWKGACGW
jgi:alanine racemase